MRDRIKRLGGRGGGGVKQETHKQTQSSYRRDVGSTSQMQPAADLKNLSREECTAAAVCTRLRLRILQGCRGTGRGRMETEELA